MSAQDMLCCPALSLDSSVTTTKESAILTISWRPSDEHYPFFIRALLGLPPSDCSQTGQGDTKKAFQGVGAKEKFLVRARTPKCQPPSRGAPNRLSPETPRLCCFPRPRRPQKNKKMSGYCGLLHILVFVAALSALWYSQLNPRPFTIS
jgi:hypothetical protein